MSLFWKSYSIIFIFVCLQSLFYLINPNTLLHQYYQINIQFNSLFVFHYWANLVSLSISLFSGLIIIFYAFQISIAPLKSPMILFLRIIFDIFGHYYAFQMILSNFYQSTYFGISTIAIFIIPIIPSYIAHWKYIKKSF